MQQRTSWEILHPLFAAAQGIAQRGPFWTQGAGGNVSLKFIDPITGQKSLVIKSSGHRLDEMNSPRGSVKVDATLLLKELRALLVAVSENSNSENSASEVSYANLLQHAAEPRSDGARPSMETGFHALLNAPLVLHFHSLPALLMADHWFAHKPDFREWMSSTAPKCEFVDWVKPGLELCHLIKNPTKNAGCIILRNHGVILTGSSEAILDEWNLFEGEFLARWHPESSEVRNWETQSGPLNWYFPDTAVFAERLLKHLELVESVPQASSENKAPQFRPGQSLKTDRDMQELWSATRQLSYLHPSLAEIPQEMLAAIAVLPTEMFRKTTIPEPGKGEKSK